MRKQLLQSLATHGDPLTIGPFSKQLQPLIQEALVECEQDKYRKGTILTPVFILWIVLASSLRRDLNYAKVIEFLASPLRWLHLALP